VGTVSAVTATALTVTLSTRPVNSGTLTAVVTTDGVSSGAPVAVATVPPAVKRSIANLAANATTLTINGFGFDPTPANNAVTFNGNTVGTVTAATASTLTITFSKPPTGAA
jgi:hypothetical protein